MRIPIVRGVIERRILVNYRVDPNVLAKLLPAPFRPKIVHGFGMAGICLIRLKQLRPKLLPGWIGISSENAAHRAAVVWDENGTVREGVFVWRRDTDSRFTACAGGRLFPGIHHHARFKVIEATDRINIALESDDGATNISVHGRPTDRLGAGSVFRSAEECSAFFEAGSLGYSVTPNPGRFQGLELRCRNWRAEPLEVEKVHSSYFKDAALFPNGSVVFDSALLMKNIEHEWYGQADLCCAAR